MDIGLEAGGMTLQQSFEIDRVCCETMRQNFSHEVIQCDITQKLVHDEKRCHVMVATYPCTKYSPIADIHGVRTGDDLFLHFFRHVAIRKPELYVVENVPGMKKFPVVMEAMTKLPDYYVHVECPVKSSTWLPQKRDRLIIIGSRRSSAIRFFFLFSFATSCTSSRTGTPGVVVNGSSKATAPGKQTVAQPLDLVQQHR